MIKVHAAPAADYGSFQLVFKPLFTCYNSCWIGNGSLLFWKRVNDPTLSQCILTLIHYLAAMEQCRLLLSRWNLNFICFKLTISAVQPAMNTRQWNLYRCNLTSDHYNAAMTHFFQVMAVAAQQWLIVAWPSIVASCFWLLSQMQRWDNK